MNLLFIGCGKMGEPIFQGVVKENIFKGITLIDPNIEHLKIQHSINVTKKKDFSFLNTELFEYVIICVKPNQFKDLDLKLNKNAKVISIMAGKTIKNIQETLNCLKVSRIMPNMGAISLASFSLVCLNEYLEQNEKDIIYRIVKSFGSYIEIEENLFDVATIGSSCSPAFFYLLAYNMQKNLTENGISLIKSKQIIQEAIICTSKILENNIDLDFKDLIQNIASKGGMTEEGLNVMNENNISLTIKNLFNRILEKVKKL